MGTFSGGAKAAQEWPTFWTRLKTIMSFSTYSPLDGKTPDTPYHTTPANAVNSNRLSLLLLTKLSDAALDPFHDNDSIKNRGFEMVECLLQTFNL